MRLRLLSIVITLLLCVSRCTMEEVGPHAQGGSSTETIGFMGVFVDTAKTVVVGARVVAEGVKVSDTAYTDNDGAYLFAFDSLALGDTFQLKATYNDSELVADIQGLVAETMFYAYDSLEGADDSLLVKLAGPDDDEGTPAALVRTDTMYAPGFIHGQVLLVDSGAGGVHAYIPGTSYGAWTDDTGGFVVSRIPPGVYDLRISHTGYVDTLLVSVAVRPNAVTAVGMVSLPLDAGYPPPSPDTIYASYDTARGIAHIRWSAVHVSDLAGYQLSADSGSGPYRVGPHVIADTCYADTVFEDLLSARSCTIRYQVRSVDTLNDMSQYSPAVTVDAAAPSLIRTTIQIRALDTATVLDTLAMVALCTSPTRNIDSLRWYVGEQAPAALRRARAGMDTNTLIDTFAYHWQDSGLKKIFVEAMDAAGTVWVDSTLVTIHGRPIPTDTTVVGEPLRVARRSLAVAAYGTAVLAVGGIQDRFPPPGFTRTPTPLVTLETMESRSAAWTSATEMPSARYAAAAAVLGDTLYVFGGTGEFESYASVEEYDMETGEWLSPARSMPSVRYGAAACSVGEWIYLFGGITDNGVDFVYSGTIERYNPRTDVWETLPDTLSERRAFHQAVAMGDSILVIGGLGGAESYLEAHALQSVELFVTSTGEIKPGPALPNQTPRFSFGAARLEGRVYVLGGLTSEFMDRAVSASESVISIGPGETSWRGERALTSGVPPGTVVPAHGFAACAVDHAVWVIGGAERIDPASPGQTSTVLKYYP